MQANETVPEALSFPPIKEGFGWNRTIRDAVLLIRQHHQLSRTQLADKLGLTPAAMTQMFRLLLKMKIVRAGELVAAPGRGRPQQMLRIGEASFYCLGIAIGYQVDLVLLDLSHRIIARQQLPNRFCDAPCDANGSMEKLIRATKKMMDRISGGWLLGIGVSVSGNVRADHTGVDSANDFMSAEQCRVFLERLRQMAACPVRVVNDTHVSVLAERWFDLALPDNPSLLYVTWRLGVGMILEGRLYEGPSAWYRDLSHFQVNRDGARCYCGRRGCLAATTASPLAIVDRLMGRIWGDPALPLLKRRAELKALRQRYLHGDRTVIKWVHQGLEDLGMAIRNLSVIFSFDSVVFEPWDARLARNFIRRLEGATTGMAAGLRPLEKIRLPSLGDFQQAVGAAVFSMEQALEGSPSAWKWIGDGQPSFARAGFDRNGWELKLRKQAM